MSLQAADLSAFCLAAIFLATGCWHLAKPAFFLGITPRWVPWPRCVNVLVAGFELLLVPGLAWPQSRPYAAWAAFAFFFAVVPVHLDMLRPGRDKGVPRWALWLRLMLQIPLIVWAFSLR